MAQIVLPRVISSFHLMARNAALGRAAALTRMQWSIIYDFWEKSWKKETSLTAGVCPSPSLLPDGQNVDPKEESLQRKLYREMQSHNGEASVPDAQLLGWPWNAHLPTSFTQQLWERTNSYLVNATGIWSAPIPSGNYHNWRHHACSVR